MDKVKTVKVSEETHTDLIVLGGMDDTFNSVIRRLIEFYRRHHLETVLEEVKQNDKNASPR